MPGPVLHRLAIDDPTRTAHAKASALESGFLCGREPIKGEVIENRIDKTHFRPNEGVAFVLLVVDWAVRVACSIPAAQMLNGTSARMSTQEFLKISLRLRWISKPGMPRRRGHDNHRLSQGAQLYQPACHGPRTSFRPRPSLALTLALITGAAQKRNLLGPGWLYLPGGGQRRLCAIRKRQLRGSQAWRRPRGRRSGAVSDPWSPRGLAQFR